MIYSSIFNTTASQLSSIVFANRLDAKTFEGRTSGRYKDYHTETRNVSLFLFKMAFEYLRKGNVDFANETIKNISKKLIYGNYSDNPILEIKHRYTNDYAIANTLEGLIQKVDYLQTLESYIHEMKSWKMIVAVYSTIERSLNSIYEDGYYNATADIKMAEKMFNEFVSVEEVKDINVNMFPHSSEPPFTFVDSLVSYY